MNFRQLIEKAMHEAKDEFAAIIAQKLHDIMGSGPSSPALPKPTRGRPPGSKNKAPKLKAERASAPAPEGTQRRAAPEHMAIIKEKVLGVMKPGQAMRKGEIMRLAKLPEDEDVRVRLVLARLKSNGLVTMKGVRGSAAYTMKG